MTDPHDTSTVFNDGGNPASAYMGVALLGWMQREQAIRFLTEDCWFETPMTEGGAESLWREWRDRAASVPARNAAAPQQLPLSEPDREHAERFLAFLQNLGVADVKVIKIDPMQLIVGQYYVAVNVAASYVQRCSRHEDWMAQTLPLSSRNCDVNINLVRRNFDTDIDIDLPHAEFIFGVHPQGGFGPKELLGHVMVMNVGNRMLLGKGYHRLYALVSSVAGALPERLSLVALDPGMLVSPTGEKVASENSPTEAGLGIFGDRPAVFADFFSEGLAMPVYLRRKRYQLQVRARWVATNE